MLRLFFDPRIPRGSHSERDWEDGAVSVDDVERKKDWDVKARLVDCKVLQAIDLFDIDEPEDGADLSLNDEVVRLLVGQSGMTMPED